MSSKYRLKAVEIAGFKAFTTPQRVPINNKTTFIFGENGLGKSSILEAIVWCLYGTESNVRNQFYDKSCVVNLFLTESRDSTKEYRIQRRMHQADNQSDVEVRLPDGTIQNITDFIPQLKKLEHGSGTRVIFAEQEQGRRYSHDIENFEGLIAAYLGLDVAYSLLDWLDKFISDAEEDFNIHVRVKEKELLQEVNRRAEAIARDVNAIQSQPPWNGKYPPSEGDTLVKTRSFLSSLLSILGQSQDTALITSAETALDLASSKVGELENTTVAQKNIAASSLETRIVAATELRNKLSETTQRITSLESSVTQNSADLKQIFADKGESEFIAEREALLDSQGMLIHQAHLAESAARVTKLSANDCPVCNAAIGSTVLKQRIEDLQNKVDIEAATAQSRLDSINQVLSNAASLKQTVSIQTLAISLAKGERTELEAKLTSALELQQVSIESIDEKLVQLRKSLNALRVNVQTSSSEIGTLKDELMKLQRTEQYHKRIRSLAKLNAFLQSEDYKKAQGKIAEFDQHMNSLKEIRQLLEDAYVKAFESYLPILGREMTAVYRHLTKQKSFDTVKIVPVPPNFTNQTGRKMVLQVGNPKRGVWVSPDDDDVLNGQALSALRLVPYFAFSKIGMTEHEIDFLLIDDPSQSFDTSHFNYFLELMKSVATSAQVIVASHERDRIQPKLDATIGDHNEVVVDSFDVDKGPHLLPSRVEAVVSN